MHLSVVVSRRRRGSLVVRVIGWRGRRSASVRRRGCLRAVGRGRHGQRRRRVVEERHVVSHGRRAGRHLLVPGVRGMLAEQGVGAVAIATRRGGVIVKKVAVGAHELVRRRGLVHGESRRLVPAVMHMMRVGVLARGHVHDLERQDGEAGRPLPGRGSPTGDFCCLAAALRLGTAEPQKAQAEEGPRATLPGGVSILEQTKHYRG